MENYSEEVWKNLELGDFDNGVKYEISNFGRIKSYAYDKENGRLLKGGVVQGYPMVAFTKYNEKRISRYIHKLVAEAFLERSSSEQLYIIHLDFDKKNNFFRNLKWATKQEKEAHLNRNPKFIASKKKIKYSKLSETDVIRIKQMLSRGKTRLRVIAKQFGITHTQLNRIRKGENWAHVKLPSENS
jgi:hypothetical protein